MRAQSGFPGIFDELSRRANGIGSTTSIMRLLSKSSDNIPSALRADHVGAFSESLVMTISGNSYKSIVVAAICQARAVLDHLILVHGHCAEGSAAQAAVLNADLVTFRRLAEFLGDRDLVSLSHFGARLGRPQFVVKPIDDEDRAWMSNEFSPTQSVERVILSGLSILFVDRRDFQNVTRREQSQRSSTVLRQFVRTAQGLREADTIKEIRVCGKWEDWQSVKG
jgi:hypothetical protein